MERIFAKNFARNHEKSSTWNIRCLVDDSFVPSSKRPSVSYCKLTDFCILTSVEVILGQLSTESSVYALCSKMSTKTVLFLIVLNLKNVTMTALFLRMKFTIDEIDKLIFLRFGNLSKKK